MKLRTRIASAILITSTVSLLLVVGAFLYTEQKTIDRELRNVMQAVAVSLGHNVRGALSFQDEESAKTTLQAMEAYPYIRQASIYREEGSLLAQYKSSGARIYPAPLEPGFHRVDNSLTLYEPIQFEGDVIGYVQLRSTLSHIQKQLNETIYTALVILLIGALISVLIALPFQQQITEPIIKLIDSMSKVASEKNYDIKVPIGRSDEMGELSRVFNDMLREIQERDRNLEVTVKEQTAAIGRDNKFIRKVLEAVPAVLIVLDIGNKAVRTVSRRYFDYVSGNEAPLTLNGVAADLDLSAEFVRRLEQGEEIMGELMPCEVGNESFVFEVTYIPIADTGEYLLELEDITTRIAFQNELITAKRRVETTLGSLTDAVISTDVNGHITYLNPVAENMLMTNLSEAAGKLTRDVIHTFDIESGRTLDDPVDFYVRNSRAHPIETRRQKISQMSKDSRIVECVTSELQGSQGARDGVVLVMRDVTEMRDLISKISHQATHDALTGLLNRDEFQRRLKFATTTAVSDESRHALMYLDLDKFKVVNDTCGHAAGDQLLSQLTGVMRDAVRTGDTVARLGGDEFGILMLNCPSDKAQDVAEDIRNSVHTFRFTWENEVFQVGVSIGLVEITAETAKHESVLSLADSACYAAKEGGRNRIYVYDVKDQEFADRFGQVLWANKIARALETDGFFLEAQRIAPLGDVGDGRNHYEVLIRMRGDDGRPVPPGLFLGAAENYGLMHDLDAWVVGTVLDWCKLNVDELPRIGKLAINLSGHSITNTDFHARVRQDIINSQVPGDRLCFEFTETAAISNFDAARKFIDELGSLGCTFSIDDFGTGMSSFAYLKNFPVHYLKIDGVFIKSIVESHIDAAMVRSINDVGHALKMHTIAEFVENDEIVTVLKDIGVDFAQGYGIHKPSPLDSLLTNKTEGEKTTN